MDSIFCLWGKYGEESFHPLFLHSIDVASVAESILAAFGYEERKKDRFKLFLCALHDIGKATPGFQAKVSAMATRLKEAGYDFPDYAESDHSKLGQYHLSVLLEEELELESESAVQHARIVTSHHGKILELYPDEPVDDGTTWGELRRELFRTLYELYGKPKPPEIEPKAADALFWMGLCSVADWIASNEEYFPYANGSIRDLAAYKECSEELAKEAVKDIGLFTAPLTHGTFSELFGFEEPNPVQRAAMEHAAYHAKTPFLLVIEAPMGEGKTEAALAAFCETDKTWRQRGLYFALPTQATGNMMFGRIESFLSRITKGAQLHLLHGNAAFSEAYRELKIRSVYDEEEGPLKASRWFLSKKRILLSQFGVGTVDQSEMAALRVKHFFVRLFALSGKTIIIDEVHAYDAYMSGILEVLLGWLARLGTSVILLSATLPSFKRRRLIEAYSNEVQTAAKLPSCPSILSVSSKGFKADAVDGLRRSKATIRPLASDDWPETIVSLLEEKLSDGGAAAVVLNTVGEAQELYRLLKERLKETDIRLFHARFTIEDRLAIEKEVLSRYGKEGERPYRSVVVATQVIEQSLDVDFDMMISFPSPIDLLLQRMGRLHRHDRKRPNRLSERILYVPVPPKLEAEEGVFGKSRFIYYPDILYKTLALMQKDGQWQDLVVSFPDGLGGLVESVYSQDIDDEAIDAWKMEREGEEYAHAFLAFNASIPKVQESVEVLDGVANDYDDDPEAANAKTRLGSPTVTLIPVENEEACQIESFADIERLHKLSVNVQAKWIVERAKKLTTPRAWEKEPLLHYVKPLFPGSIEGVRYDKEYGLLIEKKEER